MLNNIRQFDICFVSLDPVCGVEQAGLRPCLILQTNAGLNFSQTVLLAPFTSKKVNKIYPFEIVVSANKENGLEEMSKLMFDQIRVADKRRIIRKIGKLESKYYSQIFAAIEAILDRMGDFR